MNSVLTSVLAFIGALAVLITVHEFGHFWVARRCGVKVLRFSIGFGRPLLRRQAMGTEVVLAAIPLGGYVKMLDEREGEVAESERHLAFNNKPLYQRTAVVAAGPVFNFLFAILAYWLMFMVGAPGVRPVIGDVTEGSPAALAGIQAGDEIIALDGRSSPTWDAVLMGLLDGALDGRAVDVEVVSDATRRRLLLELGQAEGLLDEGNLLVNIGLGPWRPVLPAVIDALEADSPAQRAGLLPGDHILTADGQPIADWEAWVQYVRARPGQIIRVVAGRGEGEVQLSLQPARLENAQGEVQGHIGARVRVPEDLGRELRTEVRYGPLRAMGESLRKTWEMSAMTLATLWKMVLGEASVKNISGPISIAQYAGQTASLGLSTFLGFLALVSISLGVLNLLPVPILDGGHLMYYLIEFFKGSPVSEQAQVFGQQIGIAALLALMGLAFYNDLARLLG